MSKQVKGQKAVKQEREMGFCVLFVRHVPTQLKSSFKAWCAKRNKPMRQAIVDYMRETVQAESR